ncbi:hypothetical protein AB0M94_38920 [Streptomyces xanthochromogenes]|uniref:DUF7739 domain-containing protein n=1 Tax=Streptomyces xanthochromogenes TaxID=67384 RepID=UPI00343F684C
MAATITISHGIDFFGELAHSTARLHTLATALTKVMPSRQAHREDLEQVVQLLRHDFTEPMEIEPEQAAAVAEALRRAAGDRFLKPTPTKEAELLAECAERAADASETWTWRQN